MAKKGIPPQNPRAAKASRAKSSLVGGRPVRSRARSPVPAWAFSIAAHLVVFAVLFWPHTASPPPQEPSAIPVALVDVPKPEPEPPGPSGPPGPPDAPPSKAPSVAAPAPTHVAALAPAPRPIAAPRPVRVAEDAERPAPDDMSDVMSDSQLAGAASADSAGGGGGGGGGDCNMARIVQQALQRDPLVRVAVSDAHRLGKSVMLWNGDWVRSGVQEGKGLSAVREAIIWELAFAPVACRNKQVHGMVLLSLADGNTRFAIGAGNWRWSDLLQLDASH